MNDHARQLLDEALAAHVVRERAWLPHDRRGRWVVMEPGAGRYLTNSPEHVRRYVDALSPKRARRFSSLSRARAFARSINSCVQRWRRTPPSGGVWQRVSPWQWALSKTSLLWLPTELLATLAAERP